MIVYLLVVKATDKKFVGLSKHTLSRVRHRLATDARRATAQPPGTLLGDVQVCGIAQCTFTLIESIEDEQTARQRRRYWIEYFEADGPKGYNHD